MLKKLEDMEKKGDSTLGDAVKVVAEENEELSGIEKQMEIAIKKVRSGLPRISKTDVKKLYNTLKNKPFNKLPGVDQFNPSFDISDSQDFVSKIKGRFNIVKEDMTYDDESVKKMFEFISKDCFSVSVNSLKQNLILDGDNTIFGQVFVQYAATRFAEQIMGSNNRKLSKKIEDDFVESIKTNGNTVANLKKAINPNVIKIDDVVNLIDDAGFRAEKDDSGKTIKLFDRDDFVNKIKEIFVDVKKVIKGIETIKENKYTEDKVIRESIFLQKEYKRLWNIK